MKLLLGVTGSVAAKLTPKLIAEISAALPGIEIKVIVTERSLHFFREADIPVVTFLRDKDEWPEGGYVKDMEILHISVRDWADVLLIAPLSADTLSDMAHGKTSKILTSAVLAWDWKKPMILAPAMNTYMWENPITQENLLTVERVYRARVIKPIEGMLACKTQGVGAMARIETIVAALQSLKID